MKKLLPWLFIGCFFTAVNVMAAEPPPLVIMKNTTDRMLNSLRQHKGHLTKRAVLHQIVRQVVLPVMDVSSISRSVVGRGHWHQASSQQRNRFVSLFSDYVTDMYSTALSAYSDEQIRFRPMRSYDSTMSRVQIYSIVQRPGAPQITLNYRLVRNGSTWKVYDFSVDGVSMVQSYRAQFADTLSHGGLDLLIRKLQSRQ